jgi:phosphate-selective porin OprO/OprP
VSTFIGKAFGRLAAGGIAALLLTAGLAHASDPAIDELRAQLEQQGKIIAELQKKLEASQQHPVAAEQAPAGGGPSVTQQDVRKIVSEALKDKEAKDKAAEAEKNDQSKFYQVGSDFRLNATYKDGRFWMESPHKDFGNWVGGYIQQDWVWNGVPSSIASNFQAANGPDPFQDQGFPRRARIDMFGYAWEQLEWGVELDFENSPINTPFANLNSPTPAGATFPTGNANGPAIAFTDLWAGVKDIPFLGTVRFGHIRDPIGLENYSSSMAMSFMERGFMFDAFYQEFQIGAQGFNSWFDQRLNLAWSVARTDPGNLQYDVDVGNGDYAITGRIAGLPIWTNNGRCFLHLALDYQYRSGEFDPNVLDHDMRFRSRPEIHESFLMPRLVDTGVLVCDQNDIIGAEALLVAGPLHIQSEFTESIAVNAAQGGKDVGTRNFQAFYAYAGYFLTGESRAYDKRMLRLGTVQAPNEPFFWVRGADGHHHWGLGAWEVLVRYDVINLDSGTIRGGCMESYTAALNWYLNPNLKFQLNYVAADREVDQPKASGLCNFFGARFQLNF